MADARKRDLGLISVEMRFGNKIRHACLCILLCLSGCAGWQGSPSNQHLSDRDWVLVTTQHFRVYSDLESEKVAALAVDLERDLDLIGQAAFQSPQLIVEPTDVIVFAESEHFYRYMRKSVGGVFYRRMPLLPESHHTVVTFGRLSTEMQTTLRHELVHDVYARNFGAAPPWINEGFAEYFSTVQLSGGRIRIGSALPHLAISDELQPFTAELNGTDVLAIPRPMIPPPSVLLRMDAEEFYGRNKLSSDEDEASIDVPARYLAAWALVQYLMGPNGEYSQRFAYFLNIVTKTSVAQAWQQAFFGVDERRLDEDFRDYLVSGRLGISMIPYRPPSAHPSPKVRALAKGEKHLLLAKLALVTRRSPSKFPGFAQEIEAAIHSAPPPAEAFYLRGMDAWSNGKHAEAQRDFESALRLEPNQTSFLRASLEVQLLQRGGRLSRDEFRNFRASVEKFETLASSPSDLFFVARFFAAAGEEQRALNFAVRAVDLDPVDPLVLSQYALVLESCGRLEDATTVQRRAIDFLHEHREVHQQFSAELKRMESLLAQQRQRASVPL